MFMAGLCAEAQQGEGRVRTLTAGESEAPLLVLVPALQVSEHQPLPPITVGSASPNNAGYFLVMLNYHFAVNLITKSRTRQGNVPSAIKK